MRPDLSYPAIASLQPEIALQYAKAGQSFEAEPPGDHFPHRPADFKFRSRVALAPSEIEAELAALKPPLAVSKQYEDPLQIHRSSSKQHHISVLFALVHRFLLRGDYSRARRTFGMLLRTESVGRPLDLRYRSLWGIGAEILLQVSDQVSIPESEGPENSSETWETMSGSRQMTRQMTKEGFEAARLYYERLILEFPYRAMFPNTLSSYHLYPILFALWIAFLEQEHRRAMLTDDNSTGSDQQSTSPSDINGSNRGELRGTHQSILRSVQELGRRMDEVLASHPYSDNRALWWMKGNVQEWMDHLSSMSMQTSSSNGLWEKPPGDSNSESEGPNAQAAVSSQARKAFIKAKACTRNSLGLI